ncbi:MAG: hypothetical protein KDA33_11190, partial [Phycisphaerales bacterium]|nr:hypothetical protein [Phycisphaerales bacterium]
AVIEINGAAFVTWGSQRAAETCASLIKRIAESQAAQRESRIVAAMEATLDLEKATETYATARESSRYARFIGNALMILVFAVCPLVIAYRGLATTWHVLAMELAIVWFFAILEFWFAHRRLYRRRKGERRMQMLLRGMTPVGAMRFSDILMRESMSDFHPLAIAKVICDAARFGSFSEDVVRDLRHPHRPADDDSTPEARAVADWFRARMLASTESALERWNVDWREFAETPAPDDETCLGYCPRCRLQHTRTSGECSNCVGVALVPFEDA